MVLGETIRDPDHRQSSRSVSAAQSVAVADVVIAARKWLPGVGVVALTEDTGLVGHGARATEAVKGDIRCSSPWAVIAYTRM